MVLVARDPWSRVGAAASSEALPFKTAVFSGSVCERRSSRGIS